MPRRLLFLCIFIVIASGFTAQCARHSQSTLASNDSWIVGKRLPAIHLMGADDTLLSRAPLAGRAFHLNTTYGFQELLFKRPLQWTELAFDITAKAPHILHVIVAKTDTQATYVRLSQKPSIPSAVRVMDPHTRTIIREDFLPQMPALAQFRVHFKREPTPDAVSIAIDGRLYAHMSLANTPGFVGFKGDAPEAHATVSNIRVVANDGVINEDFSPPESFPKIFLLTLIGYILFVALAWWQLPKLTIQLMMAVAIISTAGFCFDYFFWSYLEVNALTHRLEAPVNSRIKLDHKITTALEKWRYTVMSKLMTAPEITETYFDQRGYPRPVYNPPIACLETCKNLEVTSAIEAFGKKTATTRRLLFIGTSQTFGVGAQSLDSTFVGLHHEFLKARHSNLHLQTLNISISGGTAQTVFQSYFDNYTWYQPDRIYINLSANDGSERFSTDISEFIERVKPVPVYLITEGCARVGHLSKHHAILEQIAANKQVPLLRLQEYLNREGHTFDPLVWWDYIHYTDYGHRIVGDWLNRTLQDHSL